MRGVINCGSGVGVIDCKATGRSGVGVIENETVSSNRHTVGRWTISEQGRIDGGELVRDEEEKEG